MDGRATLNLPRRCAPWMWGGTIGTDVQLTPDQRAFVRMAIQTGRFQREEEAVAEALALWEARSAGGSRSLRCWMTLTSLWLAAKAEKSPKSR